MKVTESQLATALEGFYVRVRAGNGAMGTSRAQIADADETAKALYATLSRMQALHETGPRLADADLCARCGNQFKQGQVCDGCRESHSYQLAEALRPDGDAKPIVLKMGDPELSVIGCVLAALSDLSPFEPGEVQRVLTYIASRYGYVLATEG